VCKFNGDGMMMSDIAVQRKSRGLSSLFSALIACAGLIASATSGFSPAQARELVAFDKPHSAGSIIIDTSERRLYYVLGQGMALRYSVAVGKEGMQWSGETFVQSKRTNPGWSPTPRMRRENPYLPAFVPPGPSNPLGVRAIYLGWSEYRIHGTNMPGSIGRASSSGCIRMLNADVMDLYERVHIGAPVIVLR
jgi:lipoprotein-anchoring transpeptidase ErfK/SrfK